MKSKKAQSMPMNVIVIAIIVIVVLVIVIVFFLGGTSSIAQKIKSLFTGATSGTDLQTATQFCNEYCEQGRYNAWCNKDFRIDKNVDGTADKDTNKNYIKFYCGTPTLVKAGTIGNMPETIESLGLACTTIKPDCTGLL